MWKSLPGEHGNHVDKVIKEVVGDYDLSYHQTDRHMNLKSTYCTLATYLWHLCA
jgi:hypothetical protein